MNKAWLVVLAVLLGRDRLSLGSRTNVLHALHALPFAQPCDTRIRYLWIDVLPGDVEQIVERQIERLAQRQNDGLLGRAQGRVQGVGAVRAILHVVALDPLGGGGARDVEHLGRLAVGQARVLDLLADLRGGTGLRMNACTHAVERSEEELRWMGDRGGKPAINSSSTALARNKGMLRRGI